MTKIYKNKKNGKEATFITKYPDNRVEMEFEDGTRKTYSDATFKRWWELVDDAGENVVATSAEEDSIDIGADEVETYYEPAANDTVFDVNAVIKFIMAVTNKLGGIMLPPQSDEKIFYLKFNGKRFAVVTYSKKAVYINCLGDALKNTDIPYETTNRRFNRRYVFNVDSYNNRKTIEYILQVALDYQIHKNTKTTKITKKG